LTGSLFKKSSPYRTITSFAGSSAPQSILDKYVLSRVITIGGAKAQPAEKISDKRGSLIIPLQEKTLNG
jgi:hypothetical protein